MAHPGWFAGQEMKITKLQTLHFLAVWKLEERWKTERNHSSAVRDLRS
jgi:hypothetical protein